MDAALEQARLALAAGEVPIGAVLVIDDEIVARAFNQPISSCDPTAHAEVLVVREAARVVGNYRLTAADVYVTLEPCLMCVGAALHARVERLVFGCADPKGGAAGSLYDATDDPRLNHRITVVSGVEEAACRALLQQFFRARRKSRATR